MFKKILVPLDGSKLAEYVLPSVQMIANGCDAPVVVFARVAVSIIIPVASPEYFSFGVYSRMEAQIEFEAENYLKQIASTVKFDHATVETKILYGGAADNLIDYTQNNKVDLIIIATQGRSGLNQWIRGSVANSVLQVAHIPILMIPPKDKKQEK